MSKYIFVGGLCPTLVSNLPTLAAGARIKTERKDIKIKMDFFFHPNSPEDAYTRPAKGEIRAFFRGKFLIHL
ncbi:MAG: hypothetical protein KOO69_05560 [Victivallales bacterium]|nr:hypothetical protein [Victivallales bacterium]